MKLWPFLLAIAGPCAVTATAAFAADEVDQSSVPDRQLVDVSADQAEALISKVKEAQDNLRRGKFQTFRLLSGSVASYDEAGISPRDAFLDLPFDDVWQVTKVGSSRTNWKPYRLAYAPQGLGQAYWEIEVVLGFSDEIERITLVYKLPAPF